MGGGSWGDPNTHSQCMSSGFSYININVNKQHNMIVWNQFLQTWFGHKSISSTFGKNKRNTPTEVKSDWNLRLSFQNKNHEVWSLGKWRRKRRQCSQLKIIEFFQMKQFSTIPPSELSYFVWAADIMGSDMTPTKGVFECLHLDLCQRMTMNNRSDVYWKKHF